MGWLDLSLILPLCSTFFSLASKELLKQVHPTSYTAYVLLFSGMIIVVYNLVSGRKIGFSKWALASGLAFGLATFGFENAVSMASNPGMVNAVYRTQTVLTAVASVFLLGSKLSVMAMVGMVVALVGAVTVAIDRSTIEHFKTLATGDDSKDDKHGWLPWAAVAGVLLSVKDITAVKAIRTGMTPYSYAVSQLLFGSLIMFAYKLYKQGTLRLEMKQGGSLLEALGGMTAVALDNVLWCLILVYVMGIAPNPAYPKAITLIGVVLTAFLSKYIFAEATLDRQQWMGIFMVVFGVGTMALSSAA